MTDRIYLDHAATTTIMARHNRRSRAALPVGATQFFAREGRLPRTPRRAREELKTALDGGMTSSLHRVERVGGDCRAPMAGSARACGATEHAIVHFAMAGMLRSPFAANG